MMAAKLMIDFEILLESHNWVRKCKLNYFGTSRHREEYYIGGCIHEGTCREDSTHTGKLS